MRRSALVLLAALCIAAGVFGSAATAPAQAPTQLIRIPFPQDDGSLTPYSFELGYPLVTLIYDTLLWRDAEGRPQPWLATAVERRAGGTELTIRLRDGVRWH